MHKKALMDVLPDDLPVQPYPYRQKKSKIRVMPKKTRGESKVERRMRRNSR